MVIVPVLIGFTCSAVTVSVAFVPTVSDVTGALATLSHPHPPEPSSPFGPWGGASMQRDSVQELQLSLADWAAGGGFLANAVVAKPIPSTATTTTARRSAM